VAVMLEDMGCSIGAPGATDPGVEVRSLDHTPLALAEATFPKPKACLTRLRASSLSSLSGGSSSAMVG
jgi:hypothetical protein